MKSCSGIVSGLVGYVTTSNNEHTTSLYLFKNRFCNAQQWNVNKCNAISAKFSRVVVEAATHGVLETWINANKYAQHALKHKRTYLFRSLKLKNCKDSADRLFTTWSFDGQREHQQARKVLLLHCSLLDRVRSLRSRFSHHPIIK